MNSDRDRKLAALLVRAQAGDQHAYECFLREAAELLRAFLSRRMTSAKDRVEDVLQETLLTIHRARHTYLADRPVGPWLYAICEHRVAEFYRRYRRIARSEISSELYPAQIENRAAPETEGAGPLGSRVYEALTELPGRQRTIIEFLKLQGLSVKEVAVQTGMSEGAVKITAFRGYEAIRKKLGLQRR